MKDTPKYQIAVGPNFMDGKPCVFVFFESVATDAEAKEMASQVAEIMQQAFGGTVDRVQ